MSQIIRACSRRRHVLESIGDMRELALPDEMESVLGPAAPSGLIGDENVDLRILPVAHVVHEVDLGPHEIEIADVAIEKDAEPDWRRSRVLRSRVLRSWLLPVRGRKGSGPQSGPQK